jgi:hypothetical protein
VTLLANDVEQQFQSNFSKSSIQLEVKKVDECCVSSIGKSDFGSTFGSDLVIDFEADDLLTVEEFQASIEESFKRALNDLCSDAASCNPDFRQVDSVVAQFFADDGGRRVEQKGFIASRRSLQEFLNHNTILSLFSAYNTSALLTLPHLQRSLVGRVFYDHQVCRRQSDLTHLPSCSSSRYPAFVMVVSTISVFPSTSSFVEH